MVYPDYLQLYFSPANPFPWCTKDLRNQWRSEVAQHDTSNIAVDACVDSHAPSQTALLDITKL